MNYLEIASFAITAIELIADVAKNARAEKAHDALKAICVVIEIIQRAISGEFSPDDARDALDRLGKELLKNDMLADEALRRKFQ